MKNETEKAIHQPKAHSPEEARWQQPLVNVFELPEAFVIEAEMPGVGRNGMEITLDGHTLTLTGRREVKAAPATPLYVESRPGGFRRIFEVDPTIDTGKISAAIEQGLLTVQLPKTERVKPRRIAVSE